MNRILKLLAVSAALIATTPTGFLAAPLAGQTTHRSSPSAAADSGVFVVRHRGDTVATERFARTATSLEGTLDLRNSRNTKEGYNAVIAPDASVPMINVTEREDAAGGRVKQKIVQRVRVIFKEDSAAVDAVTGQGLNTRVFGTQRGAVPYLNLSFALLEQAIRRARSARPPASDVPFFNLGGGQTVTGKLSPRGSDSLALRIGSVEYHLRVGPDGRLVGARIPAQDVVAERQ
jgi:hypothetical protein